MRIMFSVVLLMLLTGCSTQSGSRALLNQPDEWPSVGMTYDQVVQALGSPHHHDSPQGTFPERAVWHHERVDVNPLATVPVVGIFVVLPGWGKYGTRHVLVVAFDEAHRVMARSWGQEKLHMEGWNRDIEVWYPIPREEWEPRKEWEPSQTVAAYNERRQ